MSGVQEGPKGRQRHQGPLGRWGWGVGLVWLIAGVPLGAAVTPPSAVAVEPLLGGWRLDADRSQDFRSALQQAQSGRSRDGGYSGPGGGGGGRPGGGPPGTGNSGFRPPVEAPDMAKLAGRVEAPPALQITYSVPTFTISTAVPGAEPDLAAPPRVITADGKKVRGQRPDGTAIKTRATWKDGELDILESPSRGPERSEIYRVAAGIDGKPELIVVVSLAGYGPMPPVSVRWVYRRAEAP